METSGHFNSSLSSPNRGRRRLFVNVLVIAVCVSILAGVFLSLYAYWATPDAADMAVTISPETTYITGPLRADGSVDYLAAINQHSREGVTLENNASVLLWQALGPGPQEAATRDAFFKELGIPTPPAEGDYFISLEQFAQQQREPEPAAGDSAADESAADESARENELETQLYTAVARPWTADVFPRLAEWLQANSKPLALVVDATHRPRRFDPFVVAPDELYQLVVALLPLASESRRLAEALLARAMFRLSAGQTDGAWDDLMAAHRLARLVGQGPHVVEGLVGLAMNEQICKAERAFLQHAELTPKQIARMRADLEVLAPLADMVEMLDTYERYTCLDNVFGVLIEMSRHGTESREDGSMYSELIAEFRSRSVDWNLVFITVNSWWDRFIAACRLPDRASRDAALARLDEECNDTYMESGGSEGTFAKVLNTRRANSEFLAYMLLDLMTPSIAPSMQIHDRNLMQLDLTKLAFAIAAYRAQHGVYPEKLSRLVPAYFAKVPYDVFAEGPIQYTVDKGGYLLHSPGPDGRYESVPEEEASDEASNDDLIVRMRATE